MDQSVGFLWLFALFPCLIYVYVPLTTTTTGWIHSFTLFIRGVPLLLLQGFQKPPSSSPGSGQVSEEKPAIVPMVEGGGVGDIISSLIILAGGGGGGGNCDVSVRAIFVEARRRWCIKVSWP